ncbi:MAG TPA: DUF6364 family protein, partial [Spirochaetia bacterium]|nr:DUF6364 family protein [Spirochaetia bacterium]
RAKEYARSKHRSVSKLVEDYLKTVSETENLKSPDLSLKATLTESIAGMFKDDYQGQEYDQLLENAVSEDYQ